MSYPDGEAAVLAILRGMTGFNADNTARADWKPLNSGHSDHYAILKPGPWLNTPDALGIGASLATWRTIIELWQRWVDDGPTIIALEELVQDVVAYLENYPSLNETALIAWVAGGGEMQQRWLRDGGPMWAVWEVYIDWQEQRISSE